MICQNFNMADESIKQFGREEKNIMKFFIDSRYKYPENYRQIKSHNQNEFNLASIKLL